MFKVNLERALIKQNKKIATPQELLLIREYDQLGDDIVDSEALNRVFPDSPAKQGKRSKSKINNLLADTKQFDQSRVFHISQIEKTCRKYHLRFLPTGYFKGAIPIEVVGKINQFEVAASVRLESTIDNTDTWNPVFVGNSYIIAPAKSFALEERPKDPLLFYKINDEYYYLIHKWGNDLNVFRRLLPILSNSLLMWGVFTSIVAVALFFVCQDPLVVGVGSDEKATAAGKCFALIIAPYLILSVCQLTFKVFGFVKKNEWDSHFL